MIKGKDEMSQRVRFNYDLLTQCIERDKATVDAKLYNKDTKLNRDCVINGVCNCGKEFSKSFKSVYLKGGMFCEECTSKNRIKRYEQNCEEKYGEGIRNPFQLEQYKEKTKQTHLIKIGFDNISKDPNNKEKVKQTNRKRYGTNHHMQNADIAENASKNAYKSKEYRMPSGEIRKLQGYETFGMNILLKTYQEDDIVTCRSEVPELWYSFEEKDTRHRHYVDFYIQSIRKCVEIKSAWTYDRNKDKVLAKQASAKKDGFSYEIWIFDEKETLIKKIV
jgi:hypothetical protein